METTKKKIVLKFMPPSYIYREWCNHFAYWSNTKFGPWVISDTMKAKHFRELCDATPEQIKSAGVRLDETETP